MIYLIICERKNRQNEFPTMSARGFEDPVEGTKALMESLESFKNTGYTVTKKKEEGLRYIAKSKTLDKIFYVRLQQEPIK